MSYKAFQDWYKEGNIRHLLLQEYNGVLISPPFSTEKCKEYSKIAVYDNDVYHIETDLPPAVSKTNAMALVNDDVWMLPYAIYDDYNFVLQLENFKPHIHEIPQTGKGQFYSVASNGNSACSFPLGYEGTQFLIYIDSAGLKTVDFPTNNKKCHMGTVYCNGKYWSMPRGDDPGYNSLMSYDGNELSEHFVPVNNSISRKFTDAVVIDNTLYSLPFGETKGLNYIIEFNTSSGEFFLHDIGVIDFAKKFNAQVLVENSIIALPYGDEKTNDSNQGVVFDTVNKKVKSFEIAQNFGGKYRYRSGIEYKGHAWFFPSGTVNCPMYKIDTDGNFNTCHYPDVMFGRPVIYKDKIHCIVYNIKDHSCKIVTIEENFDLKEVAVL